MQKYFVVVSACIAALSFVGRVKGCDIVSFMIKDVVRIYKLLPSSPVKYFTVALVYAPIIKIKNASDIWRVNIITDAHMKNRLFVLSSIKVYSSISKHEYQKYQSF